MKKTLLLLTMMMIAMVSFAKDVKTLIVTTQPQMTCSNCENKIKTNLRYEKGIKGIEASASKQQVKILYDPNKTNPETIIAAFQKFGYTATEKKSIFQQGKEKITAAASVAGEALSDAYDATKETVTKAYQKTKEAVEEKTSKKKEGCSCCDKCKENSEKACGKCEDEAEASCNKCKENASQSCGKCEKKDETSCNKCEEKKTDCSAAATEKK